MLNDQETRCNSGDSHQPIENGSGYRNRNEGHEMNRPDIENGQPLLIVEESVDVQQPDSPLGNGYFGRICRCTSSKQRVDTNSKKEFIRGLCMVFHTIASKKFGPNFDSQSSHS